MILKIFYFSIRFPIFLGKQKERNRKENQKEKEKKKKRTDKLTSLICELIRNPKISHTMNERNRERERYLWVQDCRYFVA